MGLSGRSGHFSVRFGLASDQHNDDRSDPVVYWDRADTSGIACLLLLIIEREEYYRKRELDR